MSAGWGVDRTDAASGTGAVLVSDHGALSGLTDDDHTQYLLLAGRATGQIVVGGTASGDDLTLNSTSHATKGDVFVQSAGGNVIVGGGATASEFRLLEPSGSGTNYTAFKTQAQAGDITYTLPAAHGTNGVLLNDGSGGLTWDTNISDLITHNSLQGLTTGDPHTQYRLESEDHTHQSTGAQGGQLDHGLALTGLTDDDHTQYALLAGRSGGQTVIGGTAASNNLVLRSTSNATKGLVAIADEGGNVTLGGGATASQLRMLEPSGGGTSYVGFTAPALAATTEYTLPDALPTVSGQVLSATTGGVMSWATGGGGSSTKAIAQAGHGFSVGNVLYLNSTTYTLADADAAATAEVVGIVTTVTDADNFTITTGGPVTGLPATLTSGTVYFLSGTAGALTATEPSTVGQISKPLLIATGTSNGIFFNMRGTTVGSATSTLAVAQASGDGSTTAFSLPATPVHENNVFVTISGVAQHRDTYSVSGSTLTFSAAPPTGTSNIEFIVVGSVAIGTPGDGTVTNAKMAAGALFTLATEQASTSGTAIDFTGIPSGTQMIVVTFEGVGTNGTGTVQIQVGDSGGLETSGYVGQTWLGTETPANIIIQFPGTGFDLGWGAAANVIYARVTMSLLDAANNTWSLDGVSGVSNSDFGGVLVGFKSLTAALDRIRVNTTAGDTFDAGSINIMYR